MRALQFVLATSLLLAAGTTSAQTFYIPSATQMPLTVTVSPAGAVAVASNAIYTAVESYMGEVRASVGYNFSCSDEISASTFRVQEVLNGYTNENYKLVKGAAHFKGMKGYTWQMNAPIARVSSLAAACKATPTPDHSVVLEVRYTCSGKKEMHIFMNVTYDLVCQVAPPPPPPVIIPKPMPIPALPAPAPRPQACRQLGDCPRGSACVNAACQPAP